MTKTIKTLICLFALSLASASWAVTTQAENDLLIKQAWRAGQQLIENGMYTRGVEYLKAYVKSCPRSADGWYWLAKGYQGMGMLEKAQRAFTQALEVDPEYPPLSRVLQNRAIGEAIPLMDPAGNHYQSGLPVIDPGNGIFNDRVIANPAPIDKSLKMSSTTDLGTAQPTQIVQPSTQPHPVEAKANDRFSPMGARKVVIEPSSRAPGTNPVVPIPPVASLTGEPEGPGIPMITVSGGQADAAISSPTSASQAPTPASMPVYLPPAPKGDSDTRTQGKPVYVPPDPEN